MSWADYNDPKGFHVYDTETGRLEFIRNTDDIYRRHVYDDTDKDESTIMNHNFSLYTDRYVQLSVRSMTDQGMFDKFVESIQMANPHDFKIVQQKSILRENKDVNVEVEDTLSVIGSSIDSLDTKANKVLLKKEMISLYQEAMSMET